MLEQPPPQVPPIDRTVGYEACLKVVKEAVSVDGVQNAAMPPSNVIMGFTGRPPRTRASVDTVPADSEDSAAQAPPALPTTLIMDGPGGLYGPSFADPAPWACGGAPTPGCLPPPPAIGGRR
ncbi:hypothetical protein ACWD4P_14315 [Kitasatospora sp. NPDC002543]